MKIKTLILIGLLSISLVGCSKPTESGVSSNISIKEIDGISYYVLKDDKTYEGEYHIDEIFSDDFVNGSVYNNDLPNEVSKDGIVYDYYNFREKGEIMTYDEYVNYLKSYKTEPYYNDKDSNYIVISYGSGASWTDVLLSDVIYKENSVDVYMWDDVDGIMASGSAYILTIPTNLSVEDTIHIFPCINKEEYKNLKEFGFTQNPYEMLDKPVIYLYPTKKTDVEVKLDLDGELVCTYPTYNNEWKVTAYPDGTLVDENNLTYNYLYWEGISNKKWSFDEGFCVKGSDTIAFFEEILPKLGLNRKEANEFIIYWLPRMQNNEYNIISFQTNDYIETAKLETNPKVDTTIRVFMTFKSSKTPIKIKEQKFSTPTREGFTLVEWGGTEIK